MNNLKNSKEERRKADKVHVSGGVERAGPTVESAARKTTPKGEANVLKPGPNAPGGFERWSLGPRGKLEQVRKEGPVGGQRGPWGKKGGRGFTGGKQTKKGT